MLSRSDIEAYTADDTAATEREQWRAEYLERILRVIHQEQAAATSGETTESYEQAVRTSGANSRLISKTKIKGQRSKVKTKKTTSLLRFTLHFIAPVHARPM